MICILVNGNRICSESSAKLPKFLIPTIQENLAVGGSIKYGTFILVVWAHYSDKQVDKNNNPIVIIDDRKGELHQNAKLYEQDQLSFLKIPDIFGSLLANKRFVKYYSKMIKAIYLEPNIHKHMNLIHQDNYLEE